MAAGRLHARGGTPEHLAAAPRGRRRAGRQDEPFAIYLSLWAPPDVDMYRSFEEDYGVTDMLCAPAMVAEVDPSDSPEAQLPDASTPRPASPKRSWRRCDEEDTMGKLKLGLQLGYWGAATAARRRRRWPSRPSGSATTRCGRPRPTDPTP